MSIEPNTSHDLRSKDKKVHVSNTLSDDACQEVPQNYTLILLSSFLTKASDTLSSTKVVIPWLLASLGVPAFFGGLLVPIRESGSMLPQLAVGSWVQKKPIRKYIYTISSIAQAIALLGIVAVALSSSGSTAGWLILACIMLYSLARSFASVISKDILGKTIPKQKRGVLSGKASSLAGVFTICMGFALLFFLEVNLVEVNTKVMMILLICSAIFMAISGLLYHFIEEKKGATDSNKNGLGEAIKSLSIIKTDSAFRDFIITRALMMSSALATPYIVMLAQQTQTADKTLASIEWFGLGSFIAISGFASLVSSIFWGKQVDKDSRSVMRLTSFATALICFSTVLVTWLIEDSNSTVKASLYALIFFLLAVTHQGVRLGREIYVVDLAEGNQRTTYVTVSNTLIGILLLLVGLISAVLSEVSVTYALIFFGVMSILACVYSGKMKKV